MLLVGWKGEDSTTALLVDGGARYSGCLGQASKSTAMHDLSMAFRSRYTRHVIDLLAAQRSVDFDALPDPAVISFHFIKDDDGAVGTSLPRRGDAT